jgi:hypothetical protein
MPRKTNAKMKPATRTKSSSAYENKLKAKTKASETEFRCAPTFYVVRAFCIHFLAEQGTPTEEIAQRLGVNRSFVIKQSTLVMTPRTEQEKRISDIAKTMSESFRLANLDGLLLGRDLVTKLAGRSPVPPADPKSIERLKKRLKTPNALAAFSTTPKKRGRPSAKKLKLNVPQEPLDTRE